MKRNHSATGSEEELVELPSEAPATCGSRRSSTELDVVKLLSDSLNANFTSLSKMMADSFMSINQNMEIMNENLKQVTEWPVENEGEIDLQDEREQVSKTPTENVAGEPAKKKSKESKQELPETGEPAGSEEHNNNETAQTFLQSLQNKASNKEKTGSKINETLATNTTTLMRQKPDEECEKNTFNHILRPENCDGLSRITVNQVIWDRISAEARTNDVKMQRVQTALVKGTTNVALIADLLLKHSNEIPQELGEQIWKLSEDSLVCLGAANWELVQRRREALKPQISRHYSHLCAQKTPYTDMLFGDNITKQIKDITDDNKVTDKVLDHNRKWPRMSSRGKRGSYRGRGNTRGNYNYKYRDQGYRNVPFLGNSSQYQYYQKSSYQKPKSTATETTTKK